MEMVQFHPTGLLAGAGTRMTGTVLEEGLRGAGGYLLDASGARFMFDYDERGERATRDIVSRSIMDRIRKGLATPNGGVYISMGHLGAGQRAPRVQGHGGALRRLRLRSRRRPGRGGADRALHDGRRGFDVDCRTSMPRLYAAGEDTGGVHGANRLGGNGVANSTVFGGIAGDRDGGALRARRSSPIPIMRRSRRRSSARLRRLAAAAAISKACGGGSMRRCGTTSESCAPRDGLARARPR